MSRTAPTYSEFVTKYPAFVDSDVSIVTNALDFAERYLDSGTWETFFSDAVELVAAHDLTMMLIENSGANGGLQASVGPISSVSGAGVSTSFESPASSRDSEPYSDSWYKKTSYGQRFLRLRKAVIPPCIMAS